MRGCAIILMYHNIGIPPKDAVLRSLYVTPRMFKFQMCYLKKAGFEVISLTDIAGLACKGNSARRLVALTFDDGYRDFYDNAFPVLRSYGFPSTVFVVSDLAGKENMWDSAEGKAREKLLDWKEISRLSKEGVTFGSHTKSHPFLSRLSPLEAEEEVAGSKAFLEEKLQTPVESFCYPYGDYDDRIVTIVRNAGYKAAVTTKRGLVHSGDDPLELRRSFIRFSTHPLLFMYKVHSLYEDRKGARI